MKNLLTWSIALFVYPMACFAGPKEDALSIVEKWDNAFVASDVDGIVKLYAPDATFIGTGSTMPVINPEGIRNYFESAFQTKFHGAKFKDFAITVLSDNAVVVVGLDVLEGIRNGQPVHAEGRVTFLIVQRDSNWQIVHFHRSATPN